MLKSCQILIKFLLLFALLDGRCLGASGDGILAFGDIRDHLEPCGCDPRTDVGGLKRLASAAQRYVQQFPGITIVNLGNISDEDKTSTSSQAIMRVLEEIHPAASLINIYEWRRIKRKLPLAKIPWVLSNASSAGDKGPWVEIIKANQYEIFGHLVLADKDLEKAGSRLVKKWGALTSVKSNANRVLLFSGGDKELEAILATKFFGVIIRSSSVSLGVEIGDLEQKDEGLLAKSIKGQVIWSVPFGGTGFLRAAGLETSALPKPLTSLLQSKSEAANIQTLTGSAIDPLQKFVASKTIHWLRPDEEVGVSPAVLKIFEDLRSNDKDRFKSLVAMREMGLKNTDFVGSEACAACHRSSYEVWKKSKHASAMVSLINKARHQDAGCVECHVLGFTKKGGYVSEERSPQFSNVQCENCHGPRRQHLENPSSKYLGANAPSARSVCAECHTPPHSPGFDAKTYWKAIEHK